MRAAAYTTVATTIIYTANASIRPQRVHAESLPSDSKAAITKMKWSGFTELRVHGTEEVNHNVKKITFILPTEDTISGLSPVTSLLSQHWPEDGWLPVLRPYTPISDNNEQGQITFMAKKYPGGKASSKMHSLVPGEAMKFKPIHEFDYKPNEHKSILLLAGGSGITPIYQLSRAILQNPEDKTKLSLIYANNAEPDILLRKEIEELERKYPDRFSKLFTVSKKASSDDSVQTGYINKAMITRMFGQGKQPGQKVLVSGPPSMQEAIGGAKGFFGWTQGSLGGVLKDLGYTKEDVHKF